MHSTRQQLYRIGSIQCNIPGIEVRATDNPSLLQVMLDCESGSDDKQQSSEQVSKDRSPCSISCCVPQSGQFFSTRFTKYSPSSSLLRSYWKSLQHPAASTLFGMPHGRTIFTAKSVTLQSCCPDGCVVMVAIFWILQRHSSGSAGAGSARQLSALHDCSKPGWLDCFSPTAIWRTQRAKMMLNLRADVLEYCLWATWKFGPLTSFCLALLCSV